jgi:hypothetical protein
MQGRTMQLSEQGSARESLTARDYNYTSGTGTTVPYLATAVLVQLYM